MVHKVIEHSLSTKEIQEIVEVIKQEQADLLNNSSDGRTNTTISVSDALKQKIDTAFGFTLPEDIPISIFNGDTLEHVDCFVDDNGKTSKEFINTYVLNLTSNVGQFKIEDNSYPLNEGTLYMFSENTIHSTINTGDNMRLSIGPCNENGQSVMLQAVEHVAGDGGSGTTPLGVFNHPMIGATAHLTDAANKSLPKKNARLVKQVLGGLAGLTSAACVVSAYIVAEKARKEKSLLNKVLTGAAAAGTLAAAVELGVQTYDLFMEKEQPKLGAGLPQLE